MSSRTIAPSLIAKLAEACDAVGGVEKKGRNDFQKYNYVKAADVAKAIRHELFQRGVVVIPHEKEFLETGRIKTNSGGEMREFRLTVDYTLYDSDSDEKITVQAFGVAMDSGDKALYKCKTGATKYFLRAIGLIPDEKDDPEFDESVDEQTDPRVTDPGTKASRKKNAKIAEFQARAWSSALRQTGKTPAQEAEFLRTRYSASTVMDLSPEDFKDAIKWAAGTEALEASLATSAQAANAKKKANGAPQPIVKEVEYVPLDELEA